MSDRLVGTSVRRVEDRRVLTGQGRYVDDIVLPGMLEAAFVRSPIAHARLVNVDVTAARDVPGVVAVLVANDVESIAGPMSLQGTTDLVTCPFSVLAREKVRYVGDPVVLVVATSRYAAEDGCDLVDIDYDPLPSVTNAHEALDPGAATVFDENEGNLLYDTCRVFGDMQAAFAGARVVSAELTQHRVTNLPMEARGGIADFDRASGAFTFYASHQNPQSLRHSLASSLHLPLTTTHVICRDVGGSFGQKGYLSREDVAIGAASVLLGRPVKWIEDRSENLISGGQAREETALVEMAVDSTGRLRGVRLDLLMDQGAYPVVPFPPYMVTNIVRTLFPGPYCVPAIESRVRIASTNKGSYVAYRGPWESETWLRERLFDIVARELGLDVAEVRLRNLPEERDIPYRMVTGPTVEDVWAKRSVDVLLDRLDYPRLSEELRRDRKAGRLRGFGMSVFMEPAPGPPDWGEAIGFPRSPQRARARLEPDARLVVFTSQMPHGQGHETTLGQVAADGLALAQDDVRIVFGDTRVTPFAMVGTGGSRSATLASGAVAGAVAAVRQKVLAVGAFLMQTSPEQVELTSGAVRIADRPERSVPLTDIARAVYLMSFGLPGDVPHDLEADFDYSIPPGGWTQAAHGCVVEIDASTGIVSIDRYVVVEDCGRIINPAIVEGQVRGGVAQGIGAVLFEKVSYNEDCQPVASTLMDYLAPTSADLPVVELVHLDPPPAPGRTFRGVGEGGAIGAPAALVNAIEDALCEHGVSIREQHLPPTRLLELLGTIETE